MSQQICYNLPLFIALPPWSVSDDEEPLELFRTRESLRPKEMIFDIQKCEPKATKLERKVFCRIEF